jgi:hypothetical protein
VLRSGSIPARSFEVPFVNHIVRLSASILAACALLGCASSAPPKPESVTAAGVDLGAYHSFGWQTPGGQPTATPPSSILDTNVYNAIRAQLLAKGYVEADENPDFRISFAMQPYTVEKKSSPFSIGIGMGTFGNNVGGSVGASVPVGGGTEENTLQQLVIRAVAPQTSKELWVGTSAGDLKQGLDAAAVNKAVAATMKGFPARHP